MDLGRSRPRGPGHRSSDHREASDVIVQNPCAARRIARASVARQVVDALATSLPNDLVELLRKTWADYQALLDARADSARQAPDQRTVQLKDQEITFERQSSVDVLISDTPVLTLTGQAELVLALGKIEAVVRSGQLVRVQAGQATLKASIRIEDQEVVTKHYTWPLEGFLIEFNPTVDLAWSSPMVLPRYQ